MPPWQQEANNGCRPLQTAAVSAREIEVLVRWSSAKAPEGSPAAVPTTTAARASELAWTDVVVDSGADYQPYLTQGRDDEWRCFLTDPKVSEDRFIVGYHVTPSMPEEVAEVRLVEVMRDEALAKDDSEQFPGWKCPGPVGLSSARSLGSWTPGSNGPIQLPAGAGIRLHGGRGIVLQIHYHLHEHLLRRARPDRTKLALSLARSDASVTSEVEIVTVTAPDINVPPRAVGHVASTEATLDGGSLLGLEPQMRALGRTIRVEGLNLNLAANNDDNGNCLLDVRDWDRSFAKTHFTPTEFFETAVPVPAASGGVRLTCSWDNPSSDVVTSGPEPNNETCAIQMLVAKPR